MMMMMMITGIIIVLYNLQKCNSAMTQSEGARVFDIS